jgi:hypothetical protein
VNPDVLGQDLRVINVGLEVFARELEAQGVAVAEVDWQPPVGDATVAALLVRLEDES